MWGPVAGLGLTNNGIIENHGTMTGSDASGGTVQIPSTVTVTIAKGSSITTDVSYGDTITISATAVKKFGNALNRMAAVNTVDLYFGTGGSLTTWTVQPAASLAVGAHTATITVTYNDSATATAAVSFTVNSPPSAGSLSAKVDGTGGTVKIGNGTVTITPDEGYQIKSVTVNGKEVDIPKDGKLTGLKRTDKVIVTFEEIPEAPAVDMSKYTDLDAGRGTMRRFLS